MFVLVAGRRLGKTWTMIRWLLEQPKERIIVTSTRHRQQRIVDTIGHLTSYHTDRKFWEDRVVAVGDGERLRGRATREIGIDDAEDVLRILLGAEVGFVTMNATLMPAMQPNQGSFVDGECYDARQQEGQSIYGIRPHKYPRNSAELERLKALAAEPITPERLRQLRDELGMDDGN